MSQIANRINCYYYTVYKIVYKYNKAKCKPIASILRILKTKLQETNFSISQSTGLSHSVVAKAMASSTKYRFNPEYFQIIYDYLTEESKKTKSNLKYTLVYPHKLELSLYNLQLNQRQMNYAKDILFLVGSLGKHFRNFIPEDFFYDYLYRAQVKQSTMNKTIFILRTNGFIYVLGKKITKMLEYPVYLSEKKKLYLFSSLASYLYKNGDYTQAFGFAMLQHNKKLTDECFIKALIQNENLTDTEKRSFLIELYEKTIKEQIPLFMQAFSTIKS